MKTEIIEIVDTKEHCMKFTPRINQAIIRSTQLHFDQLRKASGLPYIIHPYAVALMVASYTEDEDTIIAGLLHDVLEDVPKEIYSDEDMIAEFGQNVYDIVKGVSENKDARITKEEELASWKERKTHTIEQLQHVREESLIVAAADKIHNMMSLCDEYRKSGPACLAPFNAPEDKAEHILWYNESILAVVQQRLKSGIVEDVEKAVVELRAILKPSP